MTLAPSTSIPIQRHSPHSGGSKSTDLLEKFTFSRDNLDKEDRKPLGSGLYGSVYVARTVDDTLGDYVTVKLISTKDDSIKQLLRDEIDMFAKVNHENVARLVGICRDQDPVLIIYEYLEWGNLKHYMIWSRSPDGPAPLNEGQIVSIAYQISQGMEHISDQRFVHRDLAARNVLLGPGFPDSAMMAQPFAIKITSLSLQDSPFMVEYHILRNQTLPIRWMSPETLADDDYSMKSDVWAYGVLLWELFTLGELPYQLLSNDDVIRHVQCGTTIPDIRDDVSDSAADLLRSCWSSDPRKRLTFTQIRDETGRMHVETGL